jgi:hypothetical protein
MRDSVGKLCMGVGDQLWRVRVWVSPACALEEKLGEVKGRERQRVD